MHFIYLLLIPQSFDRLAAFHLDMLQAILSIAVWLSAAVFLAACFKYCSPGLPLPFFQILFLEEWLQQTRYTYVHEWRLFLLIC